MKEMFSYSDGFHISLKKMLCSIGGVMSLGAKVLSRFPKLEEILKTNQICQYSNDSQGGLSGRDLAAATFSLYEAVTIEYLETRICQTQKLGKKLKEAGLPIVWPPGGHAIYLKINDLFSERQWSDFMGCGFVIEMIKRFGIRGCEMGYMAWGLDVYLEKNEGKFPEKMPPNFVRFAIPPNVYGDAHMDFVASSIIKLALDKAYIPRVTLSHGKYTPLRHFFVSLKPHYDFMPEKEIIQKMESSMM